jgi:hypothetical protein
MGCFQTDFDVPLSLALASIAIAMWAALVPQYAFISFAAAMLYYYVAAWLLEPLCERRRYYYAIYAAGGVVSALLYAYAWNKAIEYAVSGDGVIFGRIVDPVEYAFWMNIQILSIPFTALTTLIAYVVAFKNLQPLEYPTLPTSESKLGRFIEMLGAVDDVCSDPPHDKMYRLICRGDVSVAYELSGHALVVATYYTMFRLRDLNLAENLLRILGNEKQFPDVEEATKVLEAAYKAAATCDVQAVCKVATSYTWVTLFKELVALHFAYDTRTAKRLKCKTIKAFKHYKVYERGVGWYIQYEPDPLLYFIFHAVDRVSPVCQT